MSWTPLLPGEQPDGSWILDCSGIDYAAPDARGLMAAAVAEFRVRHGLPHGDGIDGAAKFSAKDDAKLDRVSRVLAACIGGVEDADLEAFRRGFNLLFLTDITAAHLVKLREIAREEVSQ